MISCGRVQFDSVIHIHYNIISNAGLSLKIPVNINGLFT